MIALAVAAAAVATRFRPSLVAAVLVGTMTPVLSLVGLVVVMLGRGVEARSTRRARRRRAVRGVSDLADLVALGLASGHNLHGALHTASRYAVPELRGEVDAVVRLGTHRGLSHALHAADGVAADCFATMARALDRGAPMVDVVTAWAAQRRSAEHAAALERVERLPVILLFPLALLVLPGFMLLLVTPAVVTAIERLGA